MSALPLDAAAQLVLDQLNRQEDFREALGHLCVLFVARHKRTSVGRGYAKYIHSEILHDHDRAVSYLWERANKMLQSPPITLSISPRCSNVYLPTAAPTSTARKIKTSREVVQRSDTPKLVLALEFTRALPRWSTQACMA